MKRSDGASNAIGALELRNRQVSEELLVENAMRLSSTPDSIKSPRGSLNAHWRG